MATTRTIRIALVDDHTIVRAGLRMLLQQYAHLHVVGEANRRGDVLALLEQHAPDIVLLDLDLHGESALEILPQILEHSATRVIILTGARDPEVHRAAVRLGATGLVLKDQASEVIVNAIEHVYAGEAWIDPSIVAGVLHELARGSAARQKNPEERKIASLTERERQVVALICEGLPNKQIAQRLAISETTTRHHLTSIFDKLDVTNRLELVIYAYRWNLAKPPQQRPSEPTTRF